MIWTLGRRVVAVTHPARSSPTDPMHVMKSASSVGGEKGLAGWSRRRRGKGKAAGVGGAPPPGPPASWIHLLPSRTLLALGVCRPVLHRRRGVQTRPGVRQPPVTPSNQTADPGHTHPHTQSITAARTMRLAASTTTLLLLVLLASTGAAAFVCPRSGLRLPAQRCWPAGAYVRILRRGFGLSIK